MACAPDPQWLIISDKKLEIYRSVAKSATDCMNLCFKLPVTSRSSRLNDFGSGTPSFWKLILHLACQNKEDQPA
jgi:hypothetical protein